MVTALSTVNFITVPRITLFIIFSLFILLIFIWRKLFLRFVLLTLIVVLTALVRVNFVTPQNISAWFSFYNNRLVERRLLIIEEPKISGKSQLILAKDAANNIKGYIQIRTQQFPRYQFGEIIEFKGELKGLSEGQEQYRGYFKSKNIVGFAHYPELGVSKDLTLNWFDRLFVAIRKPLINIRFKYETAINRILPEPHSGLLSGILFGSKADLSDELLSLLSISGTIHIIALSGYNITIVAEASRFLTNRFSRNMAFFVPVLFIIFFVLATALSASVIRAAIMGIILLLAGRIGRQSDALIAILFACAVMVFVNPMILLYDAGFQLSFAAVCGIIFLAPRLERYFMTIGPNLGPILASTVAAQLFAWPITSYYFGSVSFISPVSNLLILPFIPLLMLFGFIVATVALFSVSLGNLLALIPWTILSYILKAVKFFSSFSKSAVHYKVSSPFLIIAYWMFLIDLLIFTKRRNFGIKKLA